MPAARARSLLREFLATATASFQFSGASLSFSGGSNDFVSYFERLLGIPSQNSSFHKLTEEQCESCIDEIVKEEHLGSAKPKSCILIQGFEIPSWRASAIETPSMVAMYYGQTPCISTSFQFATVDDFHHIQQAMADLGLCKLNEKHLKAVKERRGGLKGK
jgi:hypothetical protein